MIALLSFLRLVPLLAALAAAAALPALSSRTASSNDAPRILRRQIIDTCPEIEKSVIMDGQAMTQTVTFKIGHVTGPKTCKAEVAVDYDVAWQHAVSEINWLGHVDLSDSSIALVQLSYGFTGGNQQRRYRWSINGPTEGEWRQHTTIEPDRMVWSKCGEEDQLSVDWNVALQSTQPGVPAVGELGNANARGGPLALRMVMDWRRCEKGRP
ncbi:hypothetical protein EJ06DRAFT_23613 [Trichodelitschia bisporula]|uniref:Secreted protein n=1 Tax=Trichodelitschia bisporula TaxID=703511 RepID=A0A6G1IB19_9PEZI|nr:hypothetical protein EJ06DRAFT_23613 [Trichodelitschia bisporula]